MASGFDTQRQTQRQQQRDRRLLLFLMLIVLFFGLTGVSLIGELMLRLVTPYGAIYPQSLLARLSADYTAWDSAIISLPPLNPQAAVAVLEAVQSATGLVLPGATKGKLALFTAVPFPEVPPPPKTLLLPMLNWPSNQSNPSSFKLF